MNKMTGFMSFRTGRRSSPLYTMMIFYSLTFSDELRTVNWVLHLIWTSEVKEKRTGRVNKQIRDFNISTSLGHLRTLKVNCNKILFVLLLTKIGFRE